MQRYTIFFIIVNIVQVSGGFSTHHQELKNCTQIIWYVPSLLVATASVVELELNHAMCTVLELLMMGGKTTRNIYSIDNNKEYYIT